jgi:hypothetical protein
MATSIVVARTKLDGLEYLADDPQVAWTNASQAAARFQTLRDATRAAMRLPSGMRAFALPLTA